MVNQEALGHFEHKESIIMPNMLNKCVYEHACSYTYIFSKQILLGWRKSSSRELVGEDKDTKSRF